MEHVINIPCLTFWKSRRSKCSPEANSYRAQLQQKSHVTTLQSMLGFQEGSNLLIFAYNELYSNHHFCSSLVATNPLLYLWAGLTLQIQEPPASHSLIIVDVTQAVTHLTHKIRQQHWLPPVKRDNFQNILLHSHYTDVNLIWVASCLLLNLLCNIFS